MDQPPELNLKQKILSGLKWLAIGKFLGQFINWGMTFIVIRLLEPTDYGLMAMGSMFIAFLTIMNEMGLGASVVQNKDISLAILKQIFGVVIVVNIGLFVFLYFCSPMIGLFFNEQKLVLIVRVLALQFLIMAFLVIPQSMMDRKLDFKSRAMVDLIANIAGGLLTLALAWKGYSVWALVWGSLVVLGIRTVGYNICHPFLFLPSFSFSGMGQIIQFGGYITVEKLLWYFYSQADTLIIGKLLGKETLGFYSIGKEVASLPLQKIMPIINQITFPAFSRIQNDINLFGLNAYKAITLISIISFPVFFGISSVSEELVAVILGSKWTSAATPLFLISIALPLRMATGILVSLLKSKGKANISLLNNIMTSVLMVLGFYFGANWGIIGVSIVWPVVYPVCFLLIFINSSKYVGMDIKSVLMIILFPFLSSTIMFLSVRGACHMINRGPDSLLQLSVMIAVGAIVYLTLQFSFNRKNLTVIKNIV